MKCSLILATLGRDVELVGFLDSLVTQTHQDFELIIIDQNQDAKIDAIVDRYRSLFSLNHVKVKFSGNARARDYGIRFATGAIAAFPDDDCAYERDVLAKVVDEFTGKPDLSILVTGSYDFGKTRFSIGVNARRPRYFSRFYMMGVEFTHFFNLNKINSVDFHLDHDFGIGSKYSGAEGFELLYRLLRAGNLAFYTPHIKIYHANKDSHLLGSERMLKYSSGVGALIRKFTNQYDPSMLYFIARKMFVTPVLKMLFAMVLLDRQRMSYSYCNLIGIWQGFLAYGK